MTWNDHKLMQNRENDETQEQKYKVNMTETQNDQKITQKTKETQ